MRCRAALHPPIFTMRNLDHLGFRGLCCFILYYTQVLLTLNTCRNLLVFGWFPRYVSGQHNVQVLELMARMFNFTEEEKKLVGADSTRLGSDGKVKIIQYPIGLFAGALEVFRNVQASRFKATSRAVAAQRRTSTLVDWFITLLYMLSSLPRACWPCPRSASFFAGKDDECM